MTASSNRSGLSLAQLLESLDGASAALPDVDIQGLATDSSDVRPGYLFLARRGLQTHGLQFAAQAISQTCHALA